MAATRAVPPSPRSGNSSPTEWFMVLEAMLASSGNTLARDNPYWIAVSTADPETVLAAVREATGDLGIAP